MSFLFLILLIIIFIYIICTIVSIIQFCVDLHRCSELRQELRETIKRVKKQNLLNNEEEVESVEEDV